MMYYDDRSRVLHISKIKPFDIDINLLADIKASYNDYISLTVFKDIKYLEQKLNAKFAGNGMSVEIIGSLGNKYTSNYYNELHTNVVEYYPLNVSFIVDGYNHGEFQLLSIPYMNDICLLNVFGSYKVLVSELKNAEDITWDNKDKKLNVTLPDRSIPVAVDKKGVITFNLGDKSKYGIDSIIQGFLSHEGVTNVNPDTLFSNYAIKKLLTQREFKNNKLLGNGGINTVIDVYKSYEYRLGNTRNNLNKRLSIDKCLSEILSRDIYLEREDDYIVEGTMINDFIIRRIKWNLVNEVYIRALPIASGLILADAVKIDVVKCGAKITKYLRNLFPDLELQSYIPYDRAINSLFEAGLVLSPDVLQLMYDSDVMSIKCKSSKDSIDIIEIRFETELIGNKTAKLGDFLKIYQMNGYSPDTYTYYGDLEDKYSFDNPIADEYLNHNDILALVSLTARIVTYPELCDTLDRDADFVKKVNMSSEIFSEAFKNSVTEFLKSYSNNALECMKKQGDYKKTFRSIQTGWISYMQQRSLLRELEDMNPLALMSQVKRIVTIVKGDSVQPERRRIAMGSYGKLCPYETPSGKKIGLVNTASLGCRITKGIMETPYLRLRDVGGKKKLNTEITWMNAEEERKYRIGDSLSLVFDDKGFIVNTKVGANVPAPPGGIDKVVYDTIDSMKLEFVNAIPEGYLSTTAAMVPFAGSDDGVRLTFSLNLMKQCTYVLNSEIPYVLTSMYSHIFDYNNNYVVKAEDDGVVEDIDVYMITVKYVNKGLKSYPVRETRVSINSVTNMNYRVSVGDVFEKGKILVDSAVSRDGYFSPGVHLIAAYMPYHGYNHEDANILTTYSQNKQVSISSTIVEKRIKRDSTNNIQIGSKNRYRYIPKHGVITTLNKLSRDGKRIYEKEEIRADHCSGILYDIYSEDDDIKKEKVYKMQLLSFNKVEVGDKMAGRHGNKGCDSVVFELSGVPMFKNGVCVDILPNPCGIVSRMNTGQVSEAKLGFFGYLSGIRINSESFNGATKKDIKRIVKFMYDVCNCDRYEDIIGNYPDLPPKFIEHAMERFDVFQEWKGCFDESGKAILYNQETGTFYRNKIEFGMPYMLKIKQEVDTKQQAREGMPVECYTAISKQPTRGHEKNGGQKNGEMELIALAAHGATAMLKEDINEKSDNLEGRTNLLADMIKRPDKNGVNVAEVRPYKESNYANKAVDNLRYLVEVVGHNLDIDKEVLTGVSQDELLKRGYFDPQLYTESAEKNRNVVERVEKINDFKDDLEGLEEYD